MACRFYELLDELRSEFASLQAQHDLLAVASNGVSESGREADSPELPDGKLSQTAGHSDAPQPPDCISPPDSETVLRPVFSPPTMSMPRASCLAHHTNGKHHTGKHVTLTQNVDAITICEDEDDTELPGAIPKTADSPLQQHSSGTMSSESSMFSGGLSGDWAQVPDKIKSISLSGSGSTNQLNNGRLTRKNALHQGECLDIREDLNKNSRARIKKQKEIRLKPKETCLATRILKNHKFELFMLFCIASNALWLAVSADLACAGCYLDGDAFVVVVDNLYCTAFLFEVVIQFLAYHRKRDCIWDYWFVFNSALMAQMIFETWIMPFAAFVNCLAAEDSTSSTIVEKMGRNQTQTVVVSGEDSCGSDGGGSLFGNLRIFRLLRLSRMLRMVRFMRAMPELLFILKGIAKATRSVGLTFLLLIIIIYVAALCQRSLSEGSEVGELYFRTVPEAMVTLLLVGALLDNVGYVMDELRRDVPTCAVVLTFVILFAALTMMNMLVGVLCEVMSGVAGSEREKVAEAFVTHTIEGILADAFTDQDGNGTISIEEFQTIMRHEMTYKALRDVDVDPYALLDLADVIFQSDDVGQVFEKELTREEFMGWVMKLRNTNHSTVRDIIQLRQFIHEQNTDRNITLSHAEKERLLLAKKVDTLAEAVSLQSRGLQRLKDVSRDSVSLPPINEDQAEGTRASIIESLGS